MKFSDRISNFMSFGGKRDSRRPSSYISPIQFVRLRQDIQSWREAISEAENAYYPHRVKLQRIYMDTVLNGHIHACLKRRNDLVMLKDFGFFSGETCDEETTERFRSKWFYEFMRYALEAKYFGYSLIELGNIINDEFPELGILRRENISPDRETLSSLVYMVSGENFNDPTNEFYDWCIWVPTPSDKGTSKCGYGLLYKVANYEILLKNLLGANANYNDRYGQPTRHAKTAKIDGPEYDKLLEAMRDMGENGWIITDLQDEIEFIAAQQGNGAGFKTYDNFEKRLEQKISKVILGHADALDSTPGKLGAGQNGDESPVAQALEDIETVDARDIEYLVNDQLIPKLLKIGFPIPTGLKFKFKNDKEKEEIREKKDKSLQATATAVKTFSDAGYDVDETWLSEHTEIKLTKKKPVDIEPKQPFDDKIKNRLNKTYTNL